MSEKVVLKPCPFCGEKDDIDYGVTAGTMYGLDYVQCQKCGAQITAAHRSKNIKIEAIEAWNRRTRHDD